MQIIIMRGLPGSGKSTWAKHHHPYSMVCSADHFHMKDGVYQFDPKNITAAHNSCLRRFLAAVTDHRQNGVVIVDNTNINAWEVAPYYRLAEVYAQPVKIVRLHVPFHVAVARNVHEVSAKTIWSMYQNLVSERLPPFWNEEIVIESW